MKQEVEPGTVGQSFEDFLKEEGIHEEVQEEVIKRVTAFRRARDARARGIGAGGYDEEYGETVSPRLVIAEPGAERAE